MLAPYLALGVASLGLGLAWPWLEHFFAEAAGVPHPELREHILVYGTLAAVLGVSGIALYTARLLPLRRVEEKPLLGALHGFLYDRWLVNPLLYRLVVYPGAGLSRALARLESWLDLAVHQGVAGLGARAVEVLSTRAEKWMDVELHEALPRGMAVLSALVRRAQSGDVRLYLAYFMAGMVLAATLSAVVIFFVAHVVSPAVEAVSTLGW